MNIVERKYKEFIFSTPEEAEIFVYLIDSFDTIGKHISSYSIDLNTKERLENNAQKIAMYIGGLTRRRDD